MTDEPALSTANAATVNPGTGEPRITADALIDLRLNHPLAKQMRLLCRHDQLFWTEAGHELAAKAMELDPVYAPFNLARYRWFTDRLQRAAREVTQILILGAGFDSRAMTLPEVALRQVQV